MLLISSMLTADDRLIEHAVQTLDEVGRIFEKNAFEQERLLEEEPRGVGEPWTPIGLKRRRRKVFSHSTRQERLVRIVRKGLEMGR